MRNLPLPHRDTCRADLIASIYQYNYRGPQGHALTEVEISDVLAVYDQYDADRGAASEFLKGSNFPQTLIDALDAAYEKTYEKRSLYQLRERLFEGIGLCPICGIDPVSELDHFLPRSHFAPLAIYARNLIPNCHDCNRIKLAGFGGQNEEELAFVHAYFDSLPGIQFLEALVDISEGGLVATFQVVPEVALDEGICNRLSNQMITLNLNERYEKELNNYVMSHATAVHLEYARKGERGVRKFLRNQEKLEAERFYPNHWRPTLLRALANHDEFVGGGFVEIFKVPQRILDELLDDSD